MRYLSSFLFIFAINILNNLISKARECGLVATLRLERIDQEAPICNLKTKPCLSLMLVKKLSMILILFLNFWDGFHP